MFLGTATGGPLPSVVVLMAVVSVWVDDLFNCLQSLLDDVQRIGDVRQLSFLVGRFTMRTQHATEETVQGYLNCTLFVSVVADAVLQEPE